MKPILFNTEMVQAILDGRKTTTRRMVKPQLALDADGKEHAFAGVEGNMFIWADKPNIKTVIHPPYSPGDILYVRETWRVWEAGNPPPHCVIEYKAGGIEKFNGIIAIPERSGRWHPSIHMPKEAARLFLRVTDVWVERLQDIDDDGVVAEGMEIGAPFDEFWDRTIKKADLDKYGWEANPFVWVIEFERISKEAALEGGGAE